MARLMAAISEVRDVLISECIDWNMRAQSVGAPGPGTRVAFNNGTWAGPSLDLTRKGVDEGLVVALRAKFKSSSREGPAEGAGERWVGEVAKYEWWRGG